MGTVFLWLFIAWLFKGAIHAAMLTRYFLFHFSLSDYNTLLNIDDTFPLPGWYLLNFGCKGRGIMCQ